MATMLMSAVKSVFAPVSAVRDCPPDCQFETICSGGLLLRRQCCFRPDCVYQCGAWQQVGSC